MLRTLLKTKELKSLYNKLKLNLMGKNSIKFDGRVLVRNSIDDDRIQLNLKYCNEDYGILQKKSFNFNRLKVEEIEKFLVKISASISKEVNKKVSKKRKKEKSEEPTVEKSEADDFLPVVLCSEGDQILSGTLFNDEAWREKNYLKIGEKNFEINFNYPSIKQLGLPQVLITGYPIYPKLSVEFADKSTFSYKWYHCKPPPTTNSPDNKKTKSNKNLCTNTNKAWELVGEEATFTPTDEHLGSFFKVSCLPQDGDRVGEEVEAVSKNEVISGPIGCPFEKRHQSTKHLCGNDSFRIICYNILADLYADSDYSRDHLYPYCHPTHLSIDYRKQLLMKELEGYNSDIICLQEVDKKVFEGDLLPRLSSLGFFGLLRLKSGEMAEGCATFVRESKFTFVQSFDTNLNDLFTTDQSLESLWDVIQGNDAMKQKMLDRNSVIQTTLLRTKEPPSRHLLVGTVHLYFHPRAAHIRLIQTHLAVRHLSNVLQRLVSQENIQPHLIYCGDFNAYSGSGVHEYLSNKQVLPTHADWFTEGKAEYLPEMNLTHNLDLINLTGFPPYTNYVGGFNACLDYIYASKSLQPITTLPLPSHDDVTKYTALPNWLFPSDHIAIGCDVRWPSLDGLRF